MIKITNRGQRKDSSTHVYTVEINNDFIVEFEHLRKDGLATCLRKAARAIDNKNTSELLALFHCGAL